MLELNYNTLVAISGFLVTLSGILWIRYWLRPNKK